MERLPAPAAITFDCYGTLVDWERGILAALEPLVRRAGAGVEPGWLLARHALHESRLERGGFRSYREVLAGVGIALASDLGVALEPGEEELLAQSLPGWPTFEDTVACLRRLACVAPLGILSNVDDDLFDGTRPALGAELRWVVTAQQVGSYKPAERNFLALLERTGLEPGQILHVAQSRYHDIAPASAMGFRTVWVDRPSRFGGSGATPPANAHADLRVTGLKELCAALG